MALAKLSADAMHAVISQYCSPFPCTVKCVCLITLIYMSWYTAICAGLAGSMCRLAVGTLLEDVSQELGLAG